MHADHATRNHNYLFKNSFDPKTAHFALFARYSTMKHLAVSIYSSILIMLLLEISGEHVWMWSRSDLIFLFCFVLFVCLFLFCFVCLFVCFFFPRWEELGYNTGEHKFTYNPLINFRDFIGYFGSRGTKSEGGCQAIHFIGFDIFPTIFQGQESMTESQQS